MFALDPGISGQINKLQREGVAGGRDHLAMEGGGDQLKISFQMISKRAMLISHHLD